MAAEAAKYGMSTGLKNALEILPAVIPDIQFAVNEECQAGANCAQYNPLLAAGKPVFHIEYVNHSLDPSGAVSISSAIPELKGESTPKVRDFLCLESRRENATGIAAPAPAKDFSTVIKGPLLDPWVYYCDTSSATTVTKEVGTGGPSSGYC
jgi:hypothetical protein